MSRLSVQTLIAPAAELGPENPLAPLRPYLTASAVEARAGDADYPDRGNETAILPHRFQDGYTRRRRPRALKTAVLENDLLRATFLLEYGGRLWSLLHKPAGRELLFVNPVFQPANLAVRDAWFSGGVEWNISIIGHSPFTCSPLFAARVERDDGTPVLRLYEWDRLRCVPFQIDCWLPEGSAFLFVRVRITNPNDHMVPMYWWSNIAVHERPEVRVLSPSNKALRHDYDGSLVGHDVPIYDGVDVTYPANRRWAADMYFRIGQNQRPWIAAVDCAGRGLVHASTARLRGRKVFNWGTSPGGRRWQEFLAEPGQAYIEIQGGLAETQGEYIPMPPGAEWSWLEAYGPIESKDEGGRMKDQKNNRRASSLLLPPSSLPAVHGPDWSAAYGSIQAALDDVLPQQWLESELVRTAALADRLPVELIQHGSGWGALERRRREVQHESPLASPALPFPDESLTHEQRPWLMLLSEGDLPSQLPSQPPVSLMVQPHWRALLEQAVQKGNANNWLAWYHLGVMRYRAGERAGAREAWQRSLQIEPAPWAYRDLALLTAEEGDDIAAADLWLTAARLAASLVPLAIECCQGLAQAKRWRDMIAFVDTLPADVQQNGRVRLLRAQAAMELGDFETVRRFYESDAEIANIREKETLLSDVWFAWQEKRLAGEEGVPIDDDLRRRVRRELPPPPRFDFRMSSRSQ